MTTDLLSNKLFERRINLTCVNLCCFASVSSVCNFRRCLHLRFRVQSLSLQPKILNMLRNFFIPVFLLIFSTQVFADDWGKTGHRVVGEIAQKYLTEKTAIAVSDLLDGHSLAFVANYGDDIKSEPEMRKKYDAWHYVNFPFDKTYETHPKDTKNGDIIQAIDTCIEVLKSKKSSREDKVFHLKMLIHFIGDLHQPLHVGIGEDRGGNRVRVTWFRDQTNLHTVWDSKMLDSYQMSYTEIAANADVLSQREFNRIKKGGHRDWMNDSRELTKEIYAYHEKHGNELEYRYMYDFMDISRSQLQKGGIRLAKVLNEIFD